LKGERNLEDAAAMARRCVALEPGFEKGYLLLIRIYEALGKNAEADTVRDRYDRLFGANTAGKKHGG